MNNNNKALIVKSKTYNSESYINPPTKRKLVLDHEKEN